jgi:hypothetical protein
MKGIQTERSGVQKIVNYINGRVFCSVDDKAPNFILKAERDYIQIFYNKVQELNAH